MIYWYRYVDDVLLLFKGTHRQINKLLNFVNNIHKNIKFTVEIEQNNTINYLDLTITNNNQYHSFKIYRKPTQTDHTIHITSYHPPQHKMAAYSHMLNRLNRIPLNTNDYNNEYNTIIHIAERNGFTKGMIERMNTKLKYKIQQRALTTLHTNEADNIKKYISLEYNNECSRILQKIMKQHDYTIAHKTSNKLQQKLRKHEHNDLDCGIYKLVCNDCEKFYIGQTGRSFKVRFTEHIQEINKYYKYKHTPIKSNFAQHIIDENHSYTDIHSNMQILHRVPKGKTMDRLEELEIYKNANNPHMLNDKIQNKTNKIYDLILYSA